MGNGNGYGPSQFGQMGNGYAGLMGRIASRQSGNGGGGGGFGASYLMAGLGCFQADVNYNKPVIDYVALCEHCAKFTKPSLIAVAGFEFIFKNELDSNAFGDGNVNVYWKTPNGQKETYRCLDTARIALLEQFTKDKMEQGVDKSKAWSRCVKAINRKLWKLCAKNKDKSISDDEDSN